MKAYCCLVRLLYTNKNEAQDNLENFAIGYSPNKPSSIACRERPDVESLFVATTPDIDPAPGTDAAVTPSLERTTTFGDLFQLADCYQVIDLRACCGACIVQSMNLSNALEILFDFAYRYKVLKDVVPMYVVENMDKMYADGKAPFKRYGDRPERHTLLAEVLKLICSWI